MRKQIKWPEWWDWEIELSSHLLRRMIDREFGETDLRTMLDDAKNFAPDIEPGRYMILTKRHGQPWGIVIEPDYRLQRLVVVTAYMVE